MSAKPVIDRDWALARIALALGRSGIDVAECDAIMAWLQATQPASGRIECRACGGRGRVAAVADVSSVSSGREEIDGLDEQTRMLVQGICLACRGRGFNT